jgi:hypothetical protein
MSIIGENELKLEVKHMLEIRSLLKKHKYVILKGKYYSKFCHLFQDGIYKNDSYYKYCRAIGYARMRSYILLLWYKTMLNKKMFKHRKEIHPYSLLYCYKILSRLGYKDMINIDNINKFNNICNTKQGYQICKILSFLLKKCYNQKNKIYNQSFDAKFKYVCQKYKNYNFDKFEIKRKEKQKIREENVTPATPNNTEMILRLPEVSPNKQNNIWEDITNEQIMLLDCMSNNNPSLWDIILE